MKGTLTPVQAKFWRAYLQTSNLAQSAKMAGCRCSSLQSYSTRGREILNSLQLTLEETLSLWGLDAEFMAGKLLDGCNATRPIVATFEGRITDRVDVDDYATRAKYLEMLARMRGAFVDKVELTGRNGGDIILQVQPRLQPVTDKKKTLEIE